MMTPRPNPFLELRIMVWNFARPDPRIVELKRKPLYVETTSKKRSGPRPLSLVSSTSIPALLQVNVESREAALKWYKLSFADQTEANYKYQDARGPKVYFDCSVDTLYLGPYCGLIVYSKDMLSVMTADDRALVKKIAIDLERIRFETLALFPNLENVEVVRRPFPVAPVAPVVSPIRALAISQEEAAFFYRARKLNKSIKWDVEFTEYRAVDENFQAAEGVPRDYCSKCILKPDRIYSN